MGAGYQSEKKVKKSPKVILLPNWQICGGL